MRKEKLTHLALKVLFLLSSIFSIGNAYAHNYPDTFVVINNTDFPFSLTNMLNGQKYLISPHSRVLSPLKNVDDKTFFINAFITAGDASPSREHSNPEYFKITRTDDMVWYVSKPDNFPAGYPDTRDLDCNGVDSRDGHCDATFDIDSCVESLFVIRIIK
jgi:hypothetical protein